MDNMVKDALLKFYGVNRCGDSKSWFHPPCHLSDEVTGGWHDCGDYLKEGASQSYTASVLGLAAAVFEDVDQDHYDADQSKTVITDGIPDILYEAKHGEDFILQSFDRAGGDPSKMITSIGDFGNEHSWWGPPELQEAMPVSRGGAPRPARNEPTTDNLGKYAASLAFVGKRIQPFDAAYAEKCLSAARTIYTFTAGNIDNTHTPAYSGNGTSYDDAAFACLALLWATGERTYLDELCFDTTIGRMADTLKPILFDGGWFTYNESIFSHNMTNTDWSSTHAHVLWGFFRLILNNPPLCTTLGLSEEERLGLVEKTVHNLITNSASVGLGADSIQLPKNNLWIKPVIAYQRPWFTMLTQQEIFWNGYQAGNITELFYYYDLASKIQGLTLPNTPAGTNWKAEEVKTVLVRMMDYMLGVNPWDICMIYGIGSKNFNHPLHRASNPELNMSYAEYPYRHLVGALQGGSQPATSLYQEHVNEWHHSEVGIAATTNILMPVVGLSSADFTVASKHPETTTRLQPAPSFTTRFLRQGTIKITAKEGIRSAALYTVSGRVVTQKRLANTTTTIRLDGGTCSGIYLLRVCFSNGAQRTTKLSGIGW